MLMVFGRIGIYADFVVLKHTVFAIPFAYLGAFLASMLFLKSFPTIYILLWVGLAFLGARSGAMAINNLVDIDIDRKNLRTAIRPLPAGLIHKREVYGIIAASYAVFFASAYMLNELCLILSPLVLITSFVYPYLKRFSWASHIIIGLNLGYAPLGGWIAVTGVLHLPPTTYELGVFALVLAVVFWVAGFDVIYSLLDVEFDRQNGLHSIPACLGVERALVVSAIFHGLMFLLLTVSYLLFDLGKVFLIGLVVIGALLVYEHWIVRGVDPEKIGLAFLWINGGVSISLLLFMVADLVI